MSKYSVDVTDPAKQDLMDVVRHISAQLSAPQASLDMFELLVSELQSLEINPKRYALLRDERLAARGYRILPVKNYLIFYKIDDASRLVYIVRILYGRRDWATLLKE